MHERLQKFRTCFRYRSLQWLRGSGKNVELELETIRGNIRTSRFNMDNNMNSNLSSISHNGLPMKYSFKSIVTNVKSVLKNARLIKPIGITCGLMIFQRFTGEWSKPTTCVKARGFHENKLFPSQAQILLGFMPSKYSAKRSQEWIHMAGESLNHIYLTHVTTLIYNISFDHFLRAVAVGFVQLLASMLSGLLIDTVGRIPLLITSSVFMSLALASFGSYVHYDENNGSGGNSDWIPLLCVLIFTIAFSLGLELQLCFTTHAHDVFSFIPNRNFANLLVTNWRTFPFGISRHWKLNRNIFLLLLCFLGCQNVRRFSGKKDSSFELNWAPNIVFRFHRNFWGWMVHSGCLLLSHALVCFLLLWLFQKQKAKTWKKWTQNTWERL